MTVLEFVAAMVGHLVWPATAITTLLILRRPITNLLPHIRRAKWGDRELEFGEQVDAVRAEVQRLPKRLESAQAALPRPSGADLPSGTPPRLIVMHHYGLAEEEVLALAEAAGLQEAASGSTTRGVFDLLFREGVIDRATYAALMDLRRLRNVAAHKSDQQITESDASEYAEVAMSLYARLHWIRQRLEDGAGA